MREKEVNIIYSKKILPGAASPHLIVEETLNVVGSMLRKRRK